MYSAIPVKQVSAYAARREPEMPGDYTSLQNRKSQLIRKAKEGSVFVDEMSSELLTSITAGEDAALALPESLSERDLGWLTEDGVGFSGDIQESTINSFGATEPTRREVTTDTTSIAVTAQETNIVNIGLYTGNDLAALVPDATTGELIVTKPPRPRLQHFRVLALSVDEHEGLELYIARYLPRATLARNPEQSYTSGDTATTWGMTFTSTLDNDAGYSERYFFGGPGWKALLGDMGFSASGGGGEPGEEEG